MTDHNANPKNLDCTCTDEDRSTPPYISADCPQTIEAERAAKQAPSSPSWRPGAGVSPDEVVHRFGYHRATFPKDYTGPNDPRPLREYAGELDDQGNVATAAQHAFVRKEFIDVTEEMLGVVPAGREQTLMLTALQEAAMWANAGIAMQAPLVRE